MPAASLTPSREKTNAVFLASYHAAMSYIRYRKAPCDDLILVDPALQLFAEYFSTYTSCRIMDGISSAEQCSACLEDMGIDSLEFWSYALSELAVFTARYAKSRRIPTKFVLTTEFTDRLFATSRFAPSILLKEPRSVIKMVLNKLRGDPIRIKTVNNYVYDCIDTGFAESVTTFRELSAGGEFANAQFRRFADFTKSKHSKVFDTLVSQRKPCILLDEDLVNFHRLTGMHPEQGMRHISDVLEKLKSRDFSVSLKPMYTGKIYLSEIYPFAQVIPREIPLEVLDVILPPDTPVTGFTSSYLKAMPQNLRPIGILQLLQEL